MPTINEEKKEKKKQQTQTTMSPIKIWWHMNLQNSRRESGLLMNLTVFTVQVMVLFCTLPSHVPEKI